DVLESLEGRWDGRFFQSNRNNEGPAVDSLHYQSECIMPISGLPRHTDENCVCVVDCSSHLPFPHATRHQIFLVKPNAEPVFRETVKQLFCFFAISFAV